MNEIAQLTYYQNDFVKIMEMLDKCLNNKRKNWCHVFKSLTVLDYCLHQGLENIVIYFCNNAYIIKTLKEFQYINEDQKDQGGNVHQKAEDITNLLLDENCLHEEWCAWASMQECMIYGEHDMEEQLVGKCPNCDEEESKRAIEESKCSLAAEQASAEEQDLQHAIKLSKEEEAARQKTKVEDLNTSALFDDANQMYIHPSY
ncbi:Epsin-1 [Termitomyces sp. J132]|nr:Epsin-1 [Termitomyces sp. J132]